MERHGNAVLAVWNDRLAVVNGMRVKVDVSKLPKPYLEPTRSCRIGEVVPKEQINVYLDFKNDEKAAESRRRGQQNRAKALGINYTEEQEKEIIRLYQQGIDTYTIAKKMQRTDCAIREKIRLLCKKYGIPKVKQNRKIYTKRKPESQIIRNNAYSPQQDAVIKSMKAEGRSYQEIADNLGRTTESVKKRWYRLQGYIDCYM